MIMFWTAWLALALALFAGTALAQSEDELNDALCAALGGERETRQYYSIDGSSKSNYVIVDCETDDLVIEGGKDSRSSLDSLQQTLFFHVLTGKRPVVAIYDTDGVLGPYEYRIGSACAEAGVQYVHIQDKDGKLIVFGTDRPVTVDEVL